MQVVCTSGKPAVREPHEQRTQCPGPRQDIFFSQEQTILIGRSSLSTRSSKSQPTATTPADSKSQQTSVCSMRRICLQHVTAISCASLIFGSFQVVDLGVLQVDLCPQLARILQELILQPAKLVRQQFLDEPSAMAEDNGVQQVPDFFQRRAGQAFDALFETGSTVRNGVGFVLASCGLLLSSVKIAATRGCALLSYGSHLGDRSTE